MARPAVYPPSLLIALDLAVRFADALELDPDLSIGGFVERSARWLDTRKFGEYMRLLEDKYGGSVFTTVRQKSGKHHVTPVGRRVIEQARELADRVDPRAAGTGRLTVASFAFSTAYILAPAVRSYYDRPGLTHPRLTFREYRHPRRALEAVAGWRVGCVFAMFQPERLNLPGYSNEVEFRPLTPGVRPVFIFPKRKAGKPATPGDLAGHRLVLPRLLPREWAPLVPRSDTESAARRVTVHSYVEVLAFVREGIGCAVFPGVFRGLLESNDIGREVGYLPFDDAQEHALNFGLFVPKHFDKEAPENLTTFVSALTEELGAADYFAPKGGW